MQNSPPFPFLSVVNEVPEIGILTDFSNPVFKTVYEKSDKDIEKKDISIKYIFQEIYSVYIIEISCYVIFHYFLVELFSQNWSSSS